MVKYYLTQKGIFNFYSCDYLRTEINRHRNRLLKLTKLSENELAELESLVTHNITFIDERLLPQDLLKQTEILLKAIDPNDTPFVALTKHLEGKLWTGDMQLYNGLKTKRFKDILTTAELSILLDDLERE
ncbi:MAG: PIN domain-containing protein [Flavobacterium sp.]|nr:PIN domain-containing protein [Flavobacterium sp.]